MTTHEYLEEDIRQAFKNVPHDVDGLFEPFKLGFLAGRLGFVPASEVEKAIKSERKRCADIVYTAQNFESNASVANKILNPQESAE